AQMVANFEHGGAAINQICKSVGASLTVIPLKLDAPTADFTKDAAMEEAEFIEAVATGYDAVPPDADLICLGEMGIGNSTSAAGLAAALFEGDRAACHGLRRRRGVGRRRALGRTRDRARRRGPRAEMCHHRCRPRTPPDPSRRPAPRQ